MIRVRLEKLTELPNALHPHNIEVGFVKEGVLVAVPKVGESFWLGLRWSTSVVTEIIDDRTFKTCNSVYRWSKV